MLPMALMKNSVNVKGTKKVVSVMLVLFFNLIGVTRVIRGGKRKDGEIRMVELIHKEITSQIIGSAYEVGNHLGFGFLEKVYENALRVELELCGLKVNSQQQVVIQYKGREVGLYQADLVVDNKVIVEIKTSENIVQPFKAQIINYLKATGLEVGLIINFSRIKVEIERVVLQNKQMYFTVGMSEKETATADEIQ
jgi:GxxExxY protein